MPAADFFIWCVPFFLPHRDGSYAIRFEDGANCAGATTLSAAAEGSAKANCGHGMSRHTVQTLKERDRQAISIGEPLPGPQNIGVKMVVFDGDKPPADLYR
jgi:hypothetical protein